MHSALLKPGPPPARVIHPPRVALRPAPDPVPRHFRPGQPLFHERDPARHVYEVVSGTLRLIRLQRDGRRLVIAFAFPGDIVGLPADGRHTTECEAITGSEVIAHGTACLSDPGQNPMLHRILVQAALHEIRALQDHFLLTGRRRALEKTAAFLTLLLDRRPEPRGACRMIRLAMNRADIADYLGLTAETVSRAFTELRGRHVLALDDASSVIVLDPARLRALAGGAAAG